MHTQIFVLSTLTLFQETDHFAHPKDRYTPGYHFLLKANMTDVDFIDRGRNMYMSIK